MILTPLKFSRSEDDQIKDGFYFSQTLSIYQTPCNFSVVKKTCKKRGRKLKSVKAQEEVEARV